MKRQSTNPTLLFWGKVFEWPIEILFCLFAASLGILFLPLIILWNLTFGLNDIRISVRGELERKERDGKPRQHIDPPPSEPRAYFEKWADETQGFILGGVAYRENEDSGYVYNEELTHVAWEGFQTGMEYEEYRSLYGGK
jgi:hypothetical protein